MLYYFLLFFSFLNFPLEETLTVEVKGIERSEGTIMIAVYDTKDTFLSKEVVASGMCKVADNGSLSCPISMPYGTYAISLFHDLNGDEELNTNFFGIPKEPYGFSNDAKGTMGPPSFEKASFVFNKENETIAITLK